VLRVSVRGRQNGAFVQDLMPPRAKCLKFSLKKIKNILSEIS
jgi:hypothetical protein